MGNVKTGLVLEGGAMRGMFTAGVLDVFMENGITFDGMIGVSAGAVFGYYDAGAVEEDDGAFLLQVGRAVGVVLEGQPALRCDGRCERCREHDADEFVVLHIVLINKGCNKGKRRFVCG